MEYERLKTYAERHKIHYRTAWSWYKSGKIPGAKNVNGIIMIPIEKEEAENTQTQIRCATYARVSSSENKDNLESQSQRLYNYATAKGYQITNQTKETGSGLNDTRPKLTRLLQNEDWDILLVEHKDRLTRFGYNYLNLLAQAQNRKIEIINTTTNKEDDIMSDLVAIITSFCARIYGNRRSQRKTEALIKELEK